MRVCCEEVRGRGEMDGVEARQGARGQGGKLLRRATASQACVEAFERRMGSSSAGIVQKMHVFWAGSFGDGKMRVLCDGFSILAKRRRRQVQRMWKRRGSHGRG